MSGRLLATRPVPGLEPVVDVLEALFEEVQLAGRLQELDGRPVRRYPEYQLRREKVLLVLCSTLEEVAGLRFAGRLPFRGNTPDFVEGVRPLGGYTRSDGGTMPSEWVMDFFQHWTISRQFDDVHQEFLRRAGITVPEGSEQDFAKLSFLNNEASWLLKGALWHVAHGEHEDHVRAAVEYVVDMAEAGQTVNQTATSWVLERLLAAGCLAEDARGFLAHFSERALTSRRDWTTFVDLEDEWAPVELHRRVQPTLSWLVRRVQATLEPVRQADSFDAWYSALTVAHEVLVPVRWALERAFDRLPLALRTIVTQYEEIRVDFSLLISRAGWGSDWEMWLYNQQDLRDTYRARGDASGDRFAVERMLVPRELLDCSNGTSQPGKPLPHAFRQPGWRTATACFGSMPALLRLSPDRRKVERVTSEDIADAFVDTVRRAKVASHGAGPVLEMLERYPWTDAVYHLLAEVHERDGDHEAALAARTAALVLLPEDGRGWRSLADSLERAGRTEAARIVLEVCAEVHARGDTLTKPWN
ncbi:hypothetical protein NLX83_03030 [Allokutzneria sp. A3M-2-11 16]|uniref:hypothetical protein n=1 Tax=Allokutzneria sp. A3M-2-11 16 TaxID=2962043 RepID=UPI0020B75757|nr:hypothetical protein [Allokutzneria sp. A3M-2-11 16]MCP3798223.1 hypothetical protein [Allokutzneria sp. A3M-2-11 16]